MPNKRLSRVDTSLVCLIQALTGKRVLIELRNDVLIKGKLESVDDYMNSTVSDASFEGIQGGKQNYEFMYVKGRNIRFVHLPRKLDVAETIEKHRLGIIKERMDELQQRLKAPVPRPPKEAIVSQSEGASVSLPVDSDKASEKPHIFGDIKPAQESSSMEIEEMPS